MTMTTDPVGIAIVTGIALIVGALLGYLASVIVASGKAVSANITAASTQKANDAAMQSLVISMATRAEGRTDELVKLLDKANGQLELSNTQQSRIIRQNNILINDGDTVLADSIHESDKLKDAAAAKGS